MQKIIVGITGASGSIYAQQLLYQLDVLKSQIAEVAVVMTPNAQVVWEYELGNTAYKNVNATFYANDNFMAPVASGSAKFDAMVIIPSSVGMLGRIANGVSNDLISRSADVMLKERRKLILVLREMPYNLIHIENMKKLILAGATICPANPSFYSKPTSIDELTSTVVSRVVDLLGLEQSTYRWGQGEN